MVQDGVAVGFFIFEQGQIYVDGPYSMFDLANCIADILDAKVFDDAGDELVEVPHDD